MHVTNAYVILFLASAKTGTIFSCVYFRLFMSDIPYLIREDVFPLHK